MSRALRRTYDRWAGYYDALYHGYVDYEGDVNFLEAIFRRNRATPKRILDLGCGTGNHAIPLAHRGYAVTGIDQSRPMLSLARKKAGRTKHPPRFVHAAMQSFRLDRAFDAAICMFGAFDYLVNRLDRDRCLRLVREHLVPRGLFIFEYWQTSGVRPGNQSWMHRTNEGLEILRLSEGAYDRRRSLLTIDFHFLVLRRREMVDRFTERHVLRTYRRQEMRSLLRRAGFSLVGEFVGTPGHKEFAPVTPTAFRIMAVARAK